MGTEDGPVCARHPDAVRMTLHTLHSSRSAPDLVQAVYACPDCGHERRLPMGVRETGGLAQDRSVTPGGA